MPSFLNHDGSFYPTANNIISPATGTTVRLQSGNTIVQQAGTLAALTTMMPSRPKTGQVVTITPTAAITALTIQTDIGGAIAGAPTAGVAGTRVSMMWNGTAWTKLS